MSWYKKANVELNFISYFDGPFKVTANGRPYTFYVNDKDFANNLKWQIENQPFRHTKIFNLLMKRYSDAKLHKELNPTAPEYTEQEKQETLQELENRGFLS